MARRIVVCTEEKRGGYVNDDGNRHAQARDASLARVPAKLGGQLAGLRRRRLCILVRVSDFPSSPSEEPGFSMSSAAIAWCDHVDPSIRGGFVTYGLSLRLGHTNCTYIYGIEVGC
jgi:hypothetical protein